MHREAKVRSRDLRPSSEVETIPELDAEDRKTLRESQFAYVDSRGEGHLPIPDESHVRNAIARFNQTEFESAADNERAPG